MNCLVEQLVLGQKNLSTINSTSFVDLTKLPIFIQRRGGCERVFAAGNKRGKEAKTHYQQDQQW